MANGFSPALANLFLRLNEDESENTSVEENVYSSANIDASSKFKLPDPSSPFSEKVSFPLR